jgi:hypothetical protein
MRQAHWGFNITALPFNLTSLAGGEIGKKRLVGWFKFALDVTVTCALLTRTLARPTIHLMIDMHLPKNLLIG